MLTAIRTTVISGALCCLLSLVSFAQNSVVAYSMQPDESRLWVEGTSNNGEWTVYATELSVAMRMNQRLSASDVGLADVDVKVPSRKVLSNKSVIMDRLVHNAFKADENPNILYELSGAEVVPGASGKFQLKAKGKLTLAGVSKAVDMTVDGEVLGNGHVRFQGSHAFAMSEFDIEPPTALFGRFRVADDVKVLFDLVMSPAG